MIKQFIVGILSSLLLLFGGTPPAPQLLGNTNYVQTQFFTLAGSGVITGATTMVLKTFHNIDGTNLTMADFGSKGFGTIEPNNGTQEDQIVFTGVTQNANGTATLTGISNVLNKYPYTETSGVSETHPGGVKFVISNTAGFYNTFANKTNNETVTGAWTFNVGPVVSSSTFIPTNPNQLVTLYAMNQATTTGGANASTLVKGVVQEATDAQLQAGTANGSLARLYANGGSFAQSSTPNKAPVSNGQGVLDPMWINTTSPYLWTGAQTINNTLTVLGTSTLATTTITTATITSSSISQLNLNGVNANGLLGGGNADSLHWHDYNRLTYVSSTSYTTSSETGLIIISSSTFPGGLLVPGTLIHLHADISNLSIKAVDKFTLNLVYGGSVVVTSTMTCPNEGDLSAGGNLDAYIYPAGTTTAQTATLSLAAFSNRISSGLTGVNNSITMTLNAIGTSAIDSSTSTSLAATIKFNGNASASNAITIDHSYVELLRQPANNF